MLKNFVSPGPSPPPLPSPGPCEVPAPVPDPPPRPPPLPGPEPRPPRAFADLETPLRSGGITTDDGGAASTTEVPGSGNGVGRAIGGSSNALANESESLETNVDVDCTGWSDGSSILFESEPPP